MNMIQVIEKLGKAPTRDISIGEKIYTLGIFGIIGIHHEYYKSTEIRRTISTIITPSLLFPQLPLLEIFTPEAQLRLIIDYNRSRRTL